MEASIFSSNLIKLRKSLKKTQVEMANILNISRAAYGSYEQGTREPDMEMLQKIANFFNVTIDYLLGRSEFQYNNVNLQDNTVISIGRGGERVVYEISDEDAAIVNAFIEKMAKKNS